MRKPMRSSHKQPKFGEMANIVKLITGASLISFSGVYVKWAHVEPLVSAFYRMFFGGIILLIFVFAIRERIRFSFVALAFAAAAGIAFSLDLMAWHRSILYIGPGLATILGNFQVFIMVFCGIVFFKERVGGRFVFSVLLAFVGLFFITGIQWHSYHPEYRTGIYLGLLTAVFYAIYLLMLRRSQQHPKSPSALASLAVITAISAASMGLFAWGQGQSLAIPDRSSLFALLAYGVSSQFVGWWLIAKSMPLIKNSLGGFILLLQPVLSFVWDILLFDREVDGPTLVGLAIALYAIYLGATTNLKRTKS